MMATNKPKVLLKKAKRKVRTTEELNSLSKEELILRIVQVEQHNEQLKNIILKNEDKQNGPGPSERKKGKFDFTKCSRRHVFLKLLYLGWEYQGFTVQEDTTNTIEHHLFTALVTCCMIENRESSNYHRCGRTDKGVSAFCQVVSLDIRSKFTEEELAADNNLIEGEMDYPKILNSKLPTNIRILGWCPVQPNLSARFDCQQRTYRYIFPRGNLDVASMSIASEQFIGKHDFRNFCKMDVGNGVTNFEREIENISVRLIQVDSGNYDQKESAYDMFEISITGRAYLWHQVRSIMGVLFLIGEGKEKISIVKDLLDVANNPQKPQYQIASDLPLCLFDCNYESVKWICSNEVQVVTIRILQQEWAKCNIKSMMLKSMLSHCEESFHGQYNIKKQASCLLQGVPSKIHKPLMERQKCSSLENRVEHYVKKKKLEFVASDDGSK